jgi:hypothetical protein
VNGNLNCHFVSRFLTKPWEFGQRRLYFYNVKTGRFDDKSSRSLFARRGINSAEIEHRLDQLIETPLASAIKDWGREPQDRVIPIDDWPAFRALALIFMMQVPRGAQDASLARELAEMCSWPDSKADEYAHGMNQVYTIGTFRPPATFPLFYPSKGYFMIPLIGDPPLHCGAMAIPLTERLAIVSVPRSFEEERFRAILSLGGGEFVCNMSVGTNAERVVVHPSVMARARPEDLGAHITKMQKNNLTLLQALSDMKSVAVAAFAEIGMTPGEALNWMGTRKRT